MTNSENIYWLFSASVQSIAAFFAFLLAGFALVLTIMDSIEEKDDTLSELHKELKKQYYNQIKCLAILTTCAIIFSLFIIFLNAYDFYSKTKFIIFSALLNIASIIWGVIFIIGIIDPNKYAKLAASEAKRDKLKSDKDSENKNINEFFNEFIKLEKIIREFLKNKNLYIPSKGRIGMSFSFRQMIDMLFSNYIIDSNTLEELQNINKIRNIVFHGHESNIDKKYIMKLISISKKVKSILNQEKKKK